ncbi:alpha/beta hydrolase [Paenibacillus sediminis]|uniref:Pimeloyl-ACP methyl ester carboxylesterase n=1 Tax=Paenibacillus sediminis TaxID=664909 RepID=A0ABS4H789_9BACL|nr:alpha/beta hydrolase [Paenibacillus sediminis]MBP1937930.1 pimeloyl-ACP methyl ester carboxylesterase [Paenibacillus sediminis]
MPYMNINGNNMYYTDNGEGISIIFVHPPVLTSLNFKYQMEGLSPYFRIIAFDIRGHGKSEPSNMNITYPLIVEDIKQLMISLNIEKAYLCGYSTGGSVVLEFLLTHPELALGGIVIGGMSEVSDKTLKSRISYGRMFAKIGAIRAIALSTAWTQADRPRLFWQLFHDAKKANANNAEQYYEYSLQYNCTAQLGNIEQPVLLIHGGKDKLFKPYAELLSQRLPNNELVTIKGADHRIPTKQADQLNRLIRQFIHRLK